MKFLHIDNSKSDIEQFNKYVEQGKHVFVLIFMVGCGPCSETIPKWKHIETVLKNKYGTNDDIVVADINKDMSSFIKHIGAIEGYPTMKYIGNKGGKVEPYESSKIPVKDRSTESFIKWIETKIDGVVFPKQVVLSKNYKQTRVRRRRNRVGGSGIILGGGRSRKKSNKRRRY